MLKQIVSAVLLSFSIAPAAFAQVGSVTGTVTDAATNEPLPGVNVVLVEIGEGVATDTDGTYELTNVPVGEHTFRVTFIGYRPHETVINVEEGENVYNVALEEDIVALEGVVVTALGIEREQRSLGYASQKVSAQDLIRSRESNFVNALQGKIAGAQITNTGGSLGSSTRIVLRGVSSLSGDNQPLFVVDGVYIDNSNFDPADEFSDMVDYGNAAMDINPNDIESVTVLRGPNAAALYGSRASNGAIIITTRDGAGTGEDGVGVSFNSTVTADDVLTLPDLQNAYGQGSGGEFWFVDGRGNGINDGVDESWGPPLDGRLIAQFWSNGEPAPWVPAPNNVRDYFETGTSFNNNIALSGSYEGASVRLSYTNLQQSGIFPGERLGRDNVSLNAGVQLTDRLWAEGRASYIEMAARNRPAVGYSYDNPMQQLTQWFGRQVDIDRLRDYRTEDGRPFNWNYNYHDNPFWMQYENGNTQRRNRLLGSVSVAYDLTDWLRVRGFTGTDQYQERRTQRNAVFTLNDPDGLYIENTRHVNEWTANAQVNAFRDVLEDFSIEATLGAEVQRRTYDMREIEAQALSVPNLYTIANAAIPPQAEDFRSEKQVNSLFGLASIGFRDYLFLDVTGRNDWSSTLPTQTNSYFYPSVSLSFIFTDAFDVGGGFLDYGKLRGGWTQVGSDTDPYQLQATYESTLRFGDIPTFSFTNTIPNAELRPERTESFEVGAELRGLDDRLNLDVTLYRGITRDQILPVQISRASGFVQQIVNAGKIRNEGVEVSLEATPVLMGDFAWDVGLNWGVNRNEVVELAEGLNAYVIGSSWDVTVQARPGEPFGTLYGQGFARDEEGNIITEDGIPVIDPEVRSFGSYQPDWTAGIRNTLTLGNLQLSGLIDIRQGGVLSSVTYMFGRYTGILEETLEGREGGYIFDGERWADGAVNPDGTPNDVAVDAETFNKLTFFGNAESHIFDASYVKLRELRLSYRIPQSLFAGLPFQNADISVVGNSLWIIHKEAPHIDPETAFSNTNLQGLESNQFPSVRSIGVNLRLTL